MIHVSGCTKEYSYEGSPIGDTHTDTLPVGDSTIKPILAFPECAECKTTTDGSGIFWNFKYDTSLLCGNITNAVITPERTAFTFFGPSTCSLDTGLVMTVYLDADTLNRDKSNIMAGKAFLDYYDNVSGQPIFLSDQQQIISLTISSYEHATGIAKGTFSGRAFTKENAVALIKEGNFEIKFP